MRFRDRREAGRLLGDALRSAAAAAGSPAGPAIVLGLPRGGVPVAFEVAAALSASLDVFMVRKLGVPGHEELAMGAIASGGVRVLNREVLDRGGIPHAEIERVTAREEAELARREEAYRGSAAPLDVSDRTVIVVDDGLATGSTMRAAVEALRQLAPRRVVVAVPTGAAQTCAALRTVADEVVCLTSPEPYYAVGQSYADFSATADDEVRSLLAQSRAA